MKTKIVMREKGYHIMIKGRQGDVTIINICKPKDRSPKYMKHKLTELKGELRNSTIIFGDFNILLSIMDIKPRQQTQRKEKI